MDVFLYRFKKSKNSEQYFIGTDDRDDICSVFVKLYRKNDPNFIYKFCLSDDKEYFLN